MSYSARGWSLLLAQSNLTSPSSPPLAKCQEIGDEGTTLSPGSNVSGVLISQAVLKPLAGNGVKISTHFIESFVASLERRHNES